MLRMQEEFSSDVREGVAAQYPVTTSPQSQNLSVGRKKGIDLLFTESSLF